MAVAKLPIEPTEFGKRVLLACEEEGRSQTGTATAAGIAPGYLSRLIYGHRGMTSMNPAHMAALAKVLHVNFEWLVVGTGPMRKGGRATTPAEQAIVFARSQGAREDAISAAWARDKDREAEMSATDWIVAIDIEARRLERAGVPRPEKAEAKRDAIQREKKKLTRARKDADKGETTHVPTLVPKPRRASGGGV